MSRKRISEAFQVWIDARKRHRLSHEQVQMARELGLNPKKLGKLDNHHQEPWKLPLPVFIQKLYRKRFGKDRPDVVVSIEDRARLEEQRRAARRQARSQDQRALWSAGLRRTAYSVSDSLHQVP